MGKPRKHLWELIHALDSSEVQKFKDRAFEYKRGRYANYVRLFDAIADQETYNESVLKELFQDEPWSRHFARNKNYLYDRVLEYIRGVRKDEETTLQGYLEKLKILIQKRLFHHLSPLATKAEQMATDIEDFQSLLVLVELRKEVLRQSKDWPRYAQELDRLHTQEKKYTHQLQELNALKQLRDQSYLAHTGKSDVLMLLLEEPILKQSSFSSTKAEIIARAIRFNAAFFHQRYDEAVEVADTILDLYQQHPGLSASLAEFNHLVATIYASASLEIYRNDTQAAERKFKLMIELADAPKREPTLYLERNTWFEVAIARKTGDYERGIKALERFTAARESSNYTFSVAVEIELAHLASIFLLNFRQPKQALSWVLENRDRKLEAFRPDILHFSKILFLVVHTELGNLDVVGRSIKPTRQSFTKMGQMNGYTTEVLRFFHALSKAPSGTGQLKVIERFLEAIGQKKPDPLWERMQNYFHLKAWLEAKLQGRPMIEVLKEYF